VFHTKAGLHRVHQGLAIPALNFIKRLFQVSNQIIPCFYTAIAHERVLYLFFVDLT
jgi:hypothetical protein